MKSMERRLVVAMLGLLMASPVGAADQSDPLGESKYPDPSLKGPPIAFTTELRASEESSVVDSPAKGRADFVLDRATMRLSWKITYQDLTSAPIAAKIHGPQTPGGEAGPLVDLAPNGVKSPLEGSIILTDGQLRYLLTDRMYVNITTQKYKLGEIRGQLARQRLKPAVSQ